MEYKDTFSKTFLKKLFNFKPLFGLGDVYKQSCRQALGKIWHMSFLYISQHLIFPKSITSLKNKTVITFFSFSSKEPLVEDFRNIKETILI